MSRIIQFLFSAGSLSAIALLGVILTTPRLSSNLRQTGRIVALTAGGAVIATLVQQRQLSAAMRRYQRELGTQRTNYQQREDALKTFSDIAMTEVESLKAQLARMEAVLEDDQVEKFSIFEAFDTLTAERQHQLHELFETAIAEATLQKKIAQLQIASQAQIKEITAQKQARITELEATLAKKTNLATQMLSELETEATNTFNQFTAKVNSQAELINSLHQQLDELKKENAKLTQRQLDKQIGHLGNNNNFSGMHTPITNPIAT